MAIGIGQTFPGFRSWYEAVGPLTRGVEERSGVSGKEEGK